MHGVVARERLYRRLDDALARGAVWIEGPPGAGKTSLAASHLEARGATPLWYQVDPGDADPSTFFYYLSLAAPARRARLPLLQPEYLPDLEGFARRFFRAFFGRLAPGAVLVLDNYQEVPAGAALHFLLSIALDELPPDIGLVVVSRTGPPPSLARARAAGRLETLAWPELQLTLDETTRICAGRRLIDAAVVGALHARCDGWAAGLALMLERATRDGLPATTDAAETQKAVFDYFAGQIFHAMPAARQSLLVTAAIGPRVTATILEALTGDVDAGRLLDELHHRHLFTDRRADTSARGGSGAVYQFHALFREFLQREAHAALGADGVASLAGRTAELLDAAGHTADAVHLHADAAQWEAAAALILREAPELLRQGRWQTVVDWTDRLPAAVAQSRPWLLFWGGKALVPIDPARARSRLEAAYERFVEDGDATGQIVSVAGIVWTHYFEAFSTERMDRWIQPLDRLLESVTDFAPPGIALAAYSAFQLVTMWVQPAHPKLQAVALHLLDLLDGDVDANERISAAAFLLQYFDLSGQFELGARVIEKIDRLASSPDLAPVGLVSWLVNRGYHFYITVRHGEGIRTLDRAVSLARHHGLAQGEFSAQVFRAFAFAVDGDTVQCADAIREQERLLQPSWLVGVAQWHLSRSLLEQERGNNAVAADLARLHLAAARTTTAPFFIIVWGSCAADVLAEAGCFDEARALIAEVRAARAGTCYQCYDGVLLLDEAYVDHLEGHPERAATLVAEALAWARQRDLPHFFRWTLKGRAILLAEALRLDIEADYARSLIAAWQLRPPTRDVPRWPWPLRIHTMGEFRILQNGAPLRFGRKAPMRLLQLVKALVAFGAKGVDVRRLAAALYPEATGDAGLASLTNGLHRLRRLLGDDTLIDLREGKLSLDLDRCWIDAHALEARCDPPPDCDRATLRASAETLLGLHRGLFLAQDDDAPWAVQPRERLRSLFERGITTLGARFDDCGDHDNAAWLFQRALEIESLAEPFYRGLIRALLALGRPGEAMQAYRRCRDLLSIVLGVKPSEATQALHARILDADGIDGAA